jgi:hypothetical protein
MGAPTQWGPTHEGTMQRWPAFIEAPYKGAPVKGAPTRGCPHQRGPPHKVAPHSRGPSLKGAPTQEWPNSKEPLLNVVILKGAPLKGTPLKGACTQCAAALLWGPLVRVLFCTGPFICGSPSFCGGPVQLHLLHMPKSGPEEMGHQGTEARYFAPKTSSPSRAPLGSFWGPIPGPPGAPFGALFQANWGPLWGPFLCPHEALSWGPVEPLLRPPGTFLWATIL